jgi:hypothetical protein
MAMKNKQKKTPKEFLEGADAFSLGVIVDDNPYMLAKTNVQKDKKTNWYSGWYWAQIKQKHEETLNRYNLTWN